jgi:hypothetical protein
MNEDWKCEHNPEYYGSFEYGDCTRPWREADLLFGFLTSSQTGPKAAFAYLADFDGKYRQRVASSNELSGDSVFRIKIGDLLFSMGAFPHVSIVIGWGPDLEDVRNVSREPDQCRNDIEEFKYLADADNDDSVPYIVDHSGYDETEQIGNVTPRPIYREWTNTSIVVLENGEEIEDRKVVHIPREFTILNPVWSEGNDN